MDQNSAESTTITCSMTLLRVFLCDSEPPRFLPASGRSTAFATSKSRVNKPLNEPLNEPREVLSRRGRHGEPGAQGTLLQAAAFASKY